MWEQKWQIDFKKSTQVGKVLNKLLLLSVRVGRKCKDNFIVNVRLGQKCSIESNTLAYSDWVYVRLEKKCSETIIIRLVACFIKIF
jgi:hypothetical protein